MYTPAPRALKAAAKHWRYIRARTSLPVEQDVALIQAFHGRDTSCYPFYLLKGLVARKTHKTFVATTDVEATRRFLASHEVQASPVLINSKHYQRLLATAGLLINNSTFPAYLIKRPEQIYLNTWHGTPLKTLGKAMPKGLIDLPNVQRNFLKSDFLFYSNEHTRNCLTRDYMIRGIHGGTELVMGSPRTEILFDAQHREELRSSLSLGEKKVCVYMPTWRGSSARALETRSFEEELQQHIETLNQHLAPEVIVLAKLHSLVANKIALPTLGRVRSAPDGLETYELLSIADVLVTDYSSVMFDFAPTRREVLLFNYDMDDYLSERGLYFPYGQLPFQAYQDPVALAERLNSTDKYVPPKRVEEFVAEYGRLDGPGATERLLDVILSPQVQAGKPIAVDAHLVDSPTNSEKQNRFARILAQNNRPDAVLAFYFGREARLVEKFLWDLQQATPLKAQLVLMNGTMQFTALQGAAEALHRLTGHVSGPLRDAYLGEISRLFGNVTFRSVTCHSPKRKLRLLAEAWRESQADAR